jgi:GTPase SAR1 family protein
MLCWRSAALGAGTKSVEHYTGKTSLLNVFTGLLYSSTVNYRLIHDHSGFITLFLIVSEPTVFENYVHEIFVDYQLVELTL